MGPPVSVSELAPRKYDREFQRSPLGAIQTCVGYIHNRGEVTRFVIQLEYHHNGEWHEVVRYDHDAVGSDEATHDVTEEGIHMDIYRNGEVEATEYVSPPLDADVAMDRAKDHLFNNLQRFVKRHEQWHEIPNR
jgi:hypothetical protein